MLSSSGTYTSSATVSHEKIIHLHGLKSKKTKEEKNAIVSGAKGGQRTQQAELFIGFTFLVPIVIRCPQTVSPEAHHAALQRRSGCRIGNGSRRMTTASESEIG
jgi:hypothetical protein